MSRRKKIYEGKAKILYEGSDDSTIIQYFKDDATAFNGEKREVLAGKGVLNNRISAHLMTKLEAIGIPTHFIRSINMREQLVRKVEIVPIEVVVRNIAAGSLCKRLGIKEGEILRKPLIEFYYKDDALGDPLISEDHIMTFGWADPYELEEIVSMAWRINDYLNGLFSGIGLKLVDFKMEFGRIYGEYGEFYIVLADEICPDTCRFWDAETGEKLDKDRFRQDLGDLVEGYQEIAERLGLIPKGSNLDDKLFEGLKNIENDLSERRRLKSIGGNRTRKI